MGPHERGRIWGEGQLTVALKVHEVKSGVVTEEDVQRMERNRAGIASDYWEIVRKL